MTSVNEVQKIATCDLRSATNEEFCKAVLRRWVPSVEDEGLKTVEIKNNDIVVLQVFFNQKSLFIRPASSSAKEVFSRLIQDVGLYCIKGIFQIEKSDTTIEFIAFGVVEYYFLLLVILFPHHTKNKVWET